MSLRSLFALLVLSTLGFFSQAQSADPPQGRLDVTDTMLGILGYTRWPTEPETIRVCVTGRSAHADDLLTQLPARAGSRALTVRRIALGADIAAQCDALYVGALEEAAWRRTLASIQGRPVLTVCERSAVCTAGGMICLDIDANARVQFEVNLDSVARSIVRINPQVLRLGRPQTRATSP